MVGTEDEVVVEVGTEKFYGTPNVSIWAAE